MFPTASNAKDLTASEILTNMDKTISGYKDQVMENTMTVKSADGKTKSYDFTIRQKGAEKRLINFTSGEVKGMAMLILGPGKVFVYLPGFKKVRRVAAHAMNQSFAGSDFSKEDTSPLPWAQVCIAKLLREDKDYWYIECKLKPEAKMHYSKLVMHVEKKTFFQAGIDYFDQDGKKIKEMRSSQPKDYHGIKRNSVVVMTDLRTGHSTRLDIREFKANQGLPNSMFTKRQLLWGM